MTNTIGSNPSALSAAAVYQPPKCDVEIAAIVLGTLAIGVGLSLAFGLRDIKVVAYAATLASGGALNVAAIASMTNKYYKNPRKTDPVVPTLKPSVSPMGAALEEIQSLYDQLLKIPRELRLEQGNQLRQKITNFKASFQQDRENNETYFLQLETTEKSVNYLLSVGGALLISNHGMDPSGEMDVPPDGNCLFFACLDKLKLLGHADIHDTTTDMDLREMTVNWLEEHKNEAEVASLLEESVDAYKNSRQVVDFNKDQHLIEVRNDRFFGTASEIHAIAHRFNVKITVKSYTTNPNIKQRTCWEIKTFGVEASREIDLNLHIDLRHCRLQVLKNEEGN